MCILKTKWVKSQRMAFATSPPHYKIIRTFRPHIVNLYKFLLKHRVNVSSIGMNNWTSLTMLVEVSLWSLRDTEDLLTMWSGT